MASRPHASGGRAPVAATNCAYCSLVTSVTPRKKSSILRSCCGVSQAVLRKRFSLSWPTFITSSLGVPMCVRPPGMSTVPGGVVGALAAGSPGVDWDQAGAASTQASATRRAAVGMDGSCSATMILRAVGAARGSHFSSSRRACYHAWIRRWCRSFAGPTLCRLEGIMTLIPTRTWVVPADLEGARLDRCLTALDAGTSRTRMQEWIAEGAVRIDGVPVERASAKVAAGQRIDLELRERPRAAAMDDSQLELNVLYDDEHLAAIDKPAGMLS